MPLGDHFWPARCAPSFVGGSLAGEPLCNRAALASSRYDWHCFLDDPANGAAPEMTIAEAQLKAASRRPVSNSLTTNPSDRLEA
jgi:hypothetical protein